MYFLVYLSYWQLCSLVASTGTSKNHSNKTPFPIDINRRAPPSSTQSRNAADKVSTRTRFGMLRTSNLRILRVSNNKSEDLLQKLMTSYHNATITTLLTKAAEYTANSVRLSTILRETKSVTRRKAICLCELPVDITLHLYHSVGRMQP